MSRPLTYTISITCSLHLTTVFKLDSLFVSLPSPLAMLLPQGPPNTRKLCIHPEIRNKNPACLCGKSWAQEKENLFRWIIHHDSPWFLDILRNHTEGEKTLWARVRERKMNTFIWADTIRSYSLGSWRDRAHVAWKCNWKETKTCTFIMGFNGGGHWIQTFLMSAYKRKAKELEQDLNVSVPIFFNYYTFIYVCRKP